MCTTIKKWHQPPLLLKQAHVSGCQARKKRIENMARACWFGSACGFKEWCCPFQLPGKRGRREGTSVKKPLMANDG